MTQYKIMTKSVLFFPPYIYWCIGKQLYSGIYVIRLHGLLWLGDAREWTNKSTVREIATECVNDIKTARDGERILICLLSPGSNWAPQDVVIFKSDMADPAHLRCVIMHQAQRCGLKLSLMLCALGFIFPIKSANYMIIQSYVQGPFWKWVAMVCILPPLMVMLEMRSTLWQEY